MIEWLLTAALLLAFWLWWDSTQAREAAAGYAKATCTAEGLQFLDDTVSFSRMRPARNSEGRLQWQRVYAFEFSTTGDNRLPGSLVTLGKQVIVLNIDVPPPPANVYTLH
jgi:hypothetical protein